MRVWACLVVAACAEARPPGAPDADGPAPDACPLLTWYADDDADGHGDPNDAIVACVQPGGRVASSDDCDDADGFAFPGATEVCDGVDTDCDAATADGCPGGCVPVRRAVPDATHVYLLCATAAARAAATAACLGEATHLVRIDDAPEQEWVRMQATNSFGANPFAIGGSDATTEGSWVWEDGDLFWTGNEGGMAAPGAFTNWAGGEPNNSNNEDCAIMKPDQTWDDRDCGDSFRYVCER